jgi:hypothetical protein
MKVITGLLFFGMLGAVLYNLYMENWSDSTILFFVLILQKTLILGTIRTTHYTLEQDTLYCRSLVFKRRIPYPSIRKIEKHTSLYAGLKMSTSFQGIIIHYNTYDELFISPAESDRFIALLKERNPGIVVI